MLLLQLTTFDRSPEAMIMQHFQCPSPSVIPGVKSETQSAAMPRIPYGSRTGQVVGVLKTFQTSFSCFMFRETYFPFSLLFLALLCAY